MKALAKLKQDLEFIKGFGEVIDTIKTAALVEFRFFQGREKLINTAFLKELEGAFNLLMSGGIASPYLSADKPLPQALVIITSDEGFLGELNTLCINSAFQNRQSDKDEIIVLGERGARYLADRGDNFVSFPGISERVDAKESQRLVNYLLRRYNRHIGRITVVYPQFLSLTSQRITIFTLLPYSLTAPKLDVSRKQADMLIEPSLSKVVKSMVNLWMNYKLLEMFFSAKQAEFAARIMHLEGSTQELSLINKKVTLSYFKQLHALSDKTIREISAAKILLKKKMSITVAG
ncbi:MAG: F0F1 ATP synthase subunit gamma [Candidatus Omnitrophota bacterium]|nr:MAG: F0F1 ATP synthase subunit gamma [Candidatus Omnitrophota bacterium]